MKGKVGLFSLFWFLTFYIDFNGSMRHVSLAGSSFRFHSAKCCSTKTASLDRCYIIIAICQRVLVYSRPKTKIKILDKWIYETFFKNAFIILGNGWNPQDWSPAASFVTLSKCKTIPTPSRNMNENIIFGNQELRRVC